MRAPPLAHLVLRYFVLRSRLSSLIPAISILFNIIWKCILVENKQMRLSSLIPSISIIVIIVIIIITLIISYPRHLHLPPLNAAMLSEQKGNKQTTQHNNYNMAEPIHAPWRPCWRHHNQHTNCHDTGHCHFHHSCSIQVIVIIGTVATVAMHVITIAITS